MTPPVGSSDPMDTLLAGQPPRFDSREAAERFTRRLANPGGFVVVGPDGEGVFRVVHERRPEERLPCCGGQDVHTEGCRQGGRRG